MENSIEKLRKEKESSNKKNFMMASEKIFDYLDSNPVQVDLRREIEII
jgi:hypothetical protein